jgi:predicted PurR-regulated permease PerM
MNILDVKAAADVTPEPQSMPAGSAGERPPIERTSSPDPAHLTNRVSLDVRGLALAVVTTVVVVFALQWAQKFFIPLLLGIIIAYTLNPLVVWLERIKIPRVVGTSMVMLAVLCGSAFVTISLRDQIQTILDQLPAAKGSRIPCRKCKPPLARSIRSPARRLISTRHPSSLRHTSSLTSQRSSWATS